MQTLKIPIRKDIKIVNVVTTAELSQKIPIDTFNEYEHLSSNLELYRCGYVKDPTMNGRVTIFGNGKMISVGTKSPKESTKELKKTVKILENYNLIKKTKIQTNVRNIVGSFDLDIKIDIVKLARTIPKSLYEPDQFSSIEFFFWKRLLSRWKNIY